MSITRHVGLFTMDDRDTGAYRDFGFEVAPRSAGVSVRLEYDSASGTLDLGCFDPSGFRGWSGSARRTFAIGPTRATPGYLAGEIGAGQWNVVIGLHRIGPLGLRYVLVIDSNAELPRRRETHSNCRPELPRASKPDVPIVEGREWLVGDLHAHSVHSDGSGTVSDVATAAAQRGLDFQAITDHNTISHTIELDAASRASGISILAGQEVTTDFGHAIVLGLLPWLDFRLPYEEWLGTARANLGLICVCHPVGRRTNWMQAVPSGRIGVEVWHSDRQLPDDRAAIDWWLAAAPQAFPIGASDLHYLQTHPSPDPLTWVQCADGDVMGGLWAGRTAVNGGLKAPLLLPLGDEVIAINAEGTTFVTSTGRRRAVLSERQLFRGSEGPRFLISKGVVLAIAT